MHSSHLLLEEPIRMVSILEPSKPVSLFLFLFNILFFLYFFLNKYVLRFQNFFPAMTKIVGTLGPKSRSVEVISACLKAGMSGISVYVVVSYFSLHCYSNILPFVKRLFDVRVSTCFYCSGSFRLLLG